MATIEICWINIWNNSTCSSVTTTKTPMVDLLPVLLLAWVIWLEGAMGRCSWFNSPLILSMVFSFPSLFAQFFFFIFICSLICPVNRAGILNSIYCKLCYSGWEEKMNRNWCNLNGKRRKEEENKGKIVILWFNHHMVSNSFSLSKKPP